MAGERPRIEFTFDLPMESFVALQQMAQAENQSRADLVRELVHQALFMGGYIDVDGTSGVLEYVAKKEA